MVAGLTLAVGEVGHLLFKGLLYQFICALALGGAVARSRSASSVFYEAHTEGPSCLILNILKMNRL